MTQQLAADIASQLFRMVEDLPRDYLCELLLKMTVHAPDENNVEKPDSSPEPSENKEEDNTTKDGSHDSISKFKRPVTLPDNIITIQRNAIENYQQPICISSLPLDENQILFSDLSAFDVLAVGQKIVEFLDSLLKQENLANQRMIREKVDY